MSQAARDQAAINRGIKAAEATGIPTKPVAGSFGISEKGKQEAAKHKAMAKAKAQAATKDINCLALQQNKVYRELKLKWQLPREKLLAQQCSAAKSSKLDHQ